MIAFWVAAALLSAAVAAFIVLRAAETADRRQAEDPSLGVYRRQLSELDDLAGRGLLPQAEQRSARAEAARRLLAAADAEAPATGASKASRVAIVALAAAAPLLALLIYLAVGSPQTPDQPFAARLKTWRADPSKLGPTEMAAVLQQVIVERPSDPAPLVYLARADVAAGDLASAEQALRKAVALDPKRGEFWLLLGETIAMQAGDNASSEARADFQRALALDPSQPGPRYFIGRDQIASGDVKGGLATWRALSDSLPASAGPRAILLRQIAMVEKTGALPASQPDQPDDAQQTMIRAMIASLAARLQAQPNDPQGWGRLIRSYAVIGDEPAKQTAEARAEALFKNRPDAWRAVEAAEANAR